MFSLLHKLLEGFSVPLVHAAAVTAAPQFVSHSCKSHD